MFGDWGYLDDSFRELPYLDPTGRWMWTGERVSKEGGFWQERRGMRVQSKSLERRNPAKITKVFQQSRRNDSLAEDMQRTWQREQWSGLATEGKIPVPENGRCPGCRRRVTWQGKPGSILDALPPTFINAMQYNLYSLTFLTCMCACILDVCIYIASWLISQGKKKNSQFPGRIYNIFKR